MGLRFVFGRGGSGKSTYLLNEIKQRVQDNETTPVILLVPEQYSFEMEKKISSLYLGKEKDKYMRTRVLTFNTMSALVFTKTGGLTATLASIDQELVAIFTKDYWTAGNFKITPSYIEGIEYMAPWVNAARLVVVVVLIIGFAQTYRAIKRKYKDEIESNKANA